MKKKKKLNIGLPAAVTPHTYSWKQTKNSKIGQTGMQEKNSNHRDFVGCYRSTESWTQRLLNISFWSAQHTHWILQYIYLRGEMGGIVSGRLQLAGCHWNPFEGRPGTLTHSSPLEVLHDSTRLNWDNGSTNQCSMVWLSMVQSVSGKALLAMHAGIL